MNFLINPRTCTRLLFLALCYKITTLMILLYVPVSRKRYKLACVPIEDSDQPAHLRRLIRVLDGHSMESQWLNVISDGQLSQPIRTDLNLRLTHLPACTLCRAPASSYLTFMFQCTRFPTMWYVRPAKPQISLRICAV